MLLRCCGDISCNIYLFIFSLQRYIFLYINKAGYVFELNDLYMQYYIVAYYTQLYIPFLLCRKVIW